MKNKIIYFLTFSIFILSCGNPSDQKSGEMKESDTIEEQNHHNESVSLELNNGEKWKIIESMMVYIRKMESDVAAFDKSAQKDHPALVEKLKANIVLLTSSCTMEGKAHDVLHEWLVPYIDLVNLLSEAKNKKEADLIFAKIQKSFKEFNLYFQ